MRSALIFLTLVAIHTTSGCHRSAGQKGYAEEESIPCDKGHYSGQIKIKEPSEISQWAGYTSATRLTVFCQECTDLSEFTCLERVENVNVANTYQLENLKGLENLETVGCLQLTGNLALRDLSALSSLSEIETSAVCPGETGISICHNPTLQSLHGLEGIQTHSGDIEISSNQVLANLDSLSGWSYVDGSMWIVNNNSLLSLDGLDEIVQIEGSLLISQNDSLENLFGLGDLETVSHGVNIKKNPVLSSMEGLDTLESIGGGLSISENNSLTELDALDSLESVGDISIRLNPSLPDCSICNLMDQLQIEDTSENSVAGNMNDSCSPLPEGCP